MTQQIAEYNPTLYHYFVTSNLYTFPETYKKTYISNWLAEDTLTAWHLALQLMVKFTLEQPPTLARIQEYQTVIANKLDQELTESFTCNLMTAQAYLTTIAQALEKDALETCSKFTRSFPLDFFDYDQVTSQVIQSATSLELLNIITTIEAWDGDDLRNELLIKRILEDSELDKTVPLYYFWMLQPTYYENQSDEEARAGWNAGTYETLQAIQKKYVAGFYTNSNITFDLDTIDVFEAGSDDACINQQFQIHEKMRRSLTGEPIFDTQKAFETYHDGLPNALLKELNPLY